METADQTIQVSATAATETASLVIFGLDDQKKPHASAFVASEADGAEPGSMANVVSVEGGGRTTLDVDGVRFNYDVEGLHQA